MGKSGYAGKSKGKKLSSERALKQAMSNAGAGFKKPLSGRKIFSKR